MSRPSPRKPRLLRKSLTGIPGLDEVTAGGLPTGRPTLICGDAGCGKTLFALHFLVRGILESGENGVFMSFEERPEDLAENVASLGFNLPALVRSKQLIIDHVRIERSEIQETGSYNLDGLFIRIASAIDEVGAKRVVLDTVEALFGGLSDMGVLRAELRRLFNWLKERGVTAIITGEKGEGTLTRHGLEEFVSDCVIVLDHRVTGQISTRRLRIAKYRGSAHGTNEYPFLIDEQGITVLPITSTGLQHTVHDERIPTGVPRLDAMLGGEGYYRGSSVLISGSAGTGKSSLAAHFARATCERGERCVYFAFEESPSQIVRNMRSIGIDLERYMEKGLLAIHSSRPTSHGLESHLVHVRRVIDDFKPAVAVFDPMTSMMRIGQTVEVSEMVMRLVDTLKSDGITALFTSLSEQSEAERSELGISSLIDTWLLLREIEYHGERNRGIFVIKSRGTAHSNQIREFVLTDDGIQLLDVYVGSDGVLTGSARIAQEARAEKQRVEAAAELERRQRESEARRQKLLAEIASLHRTIENDEAELTALLHEQKEREARERVQREAMAVHRRADQITIRRSAAESGEGNDSKRKAKPQSARYQQRR